MFTRQWITSESAVLTGRPSVCFSQPSSRAPGLCMSSQGSSLSPSPVSALSLIKSVSLVVALSPGQGPSFLAVSPAPRMAWQSKGRESDSMILSRRHQVSLCSWGWSDLCPWGQRPLPVGSGSLSRGGRGSLSVHPNTLQPDSCGADGWLPGRSEDGGVVREVPLTCPHPSLEERRWCAGCARGGLVQPETRTCPSP